MEKISPKSVKDIEKSRFWSRSRDFCQFLEGFGVGFGEFGLGKKVSVLVSEDLVSEKNYGFRLQRIWSRKKNQFRKIWYRKKKFRFRKIWYRKKSLGIGFGQNFGIIIQCTAVARIFEFYLWSHNCLHLISLFKCESESESGARI